MSPLCDPLSGGKDTTAPTNWNRVIGDVNDSRGMVAENGSAIVEHSTAPSTTDSRTTFAVQPSAAKLPPVQPRQQQQQQQLQQPQQQLVSDVSDASCCKS
jgi:hypothetical protein